MNVLFAYMSVYHMCVWSQWKSEEGPGIWSCYILDLWKLEVKLYFLRWLEITWVSHLGRNNTEKPGILFIMLSPKSIAYKLEWTLRTSADFDPVKIQNSLWRPLKQVEHVSEQLAHPQGPEAVLWIPKLLSEVLEDMSPWGFYNNQEAACRTAGNIYFTFLFFFFSPQESRAIDNLL